MTQVTSARDSKHRQWTHSKPDRKTRKAKRVMQATSRRRNRGR